MIFRFFILTCLLFAFIKAGEIGYYYENDRFLLAILMFGCEGNMHCTNSRYFEVDKQNAKSLEILSKPTPIKNSLNERLMGYKFKNSNCAYEIYGDIMPDRTVYLTISRQGKTIFKSDNIQEIDQNKFISKLEMTNKELLTAFDKFYKKLQNRYR